MKARLRDLLCLTVLGAAASAVSGLPAAPGTSAPTVTPVPVTARPPLQAVPATKVSHQLHQRMQQCNAQADQKQLRDVSRETFIKACMTPHRPRRAVTSASSAPALASEPQGNLPRHKP